MRLDEIEPEVVHIILEYVYDTSPKTIWKSVVLVNKYLHEAVQAIIHQRKTIVLSKSVEFSLEKNKWIHNAAVLQNIRHLTVEDRGDGRWDMLTDPRDDAAYQEFLGRFEPFNDFLRSIKGLKTLVWNAGPVPHTLLQVLRDSHPRAILKIFKFTRFDPTFDRLDQSEIALSTFPNLTHFRFSAQPIAPLNPSGEIMYNVYNYAAFRLMVASSKNLQYAGLIYYWRTMDPNGLDIFEQDIQTSSKQHSSQCRVKSLMFDKSTLSLSKNFLNELNEYIDISALESLKFSRGTTGIDYFKNAAAMLPKIKHVYLNLRVLEDPDRTDFKQKAIVHAAKDYLLSCSPLQTLSLWAWERVVSLNELIARHGSELETLQLHEPETPGSRSLFSHTVAGRRGLDADDLRLIRTSCPRLLSLTFDVNQENDEFSLDSQPKTLKLLDELACFRPLLPKIQIYFDSDAIHEHLRGSRDQINEYDAYSSDDEDSLTSSVAVDDESEADEQQEDGTAPSVIAANTAAQNENLNAAHSASPTTSSTGADNTNGTNQPVSIVSPPRKRCRLQAVEDALDPEPKADPEREVQNYVESFWKRIYGSSTMGERALDIKFGEWESKTHTNPQYFTRRFYQIRPHERDDKVGECVVKMMRK